MQHFIDLLPIKVDSYNIHSTMECIEKEMMDILGPEFFKDGWTKAFATPRPPGKPSDVKHDLELTLEKLYTGTNVQMKADKKIPCQLCREGRIMCLCNKCQGNGNNGQSKCHTCMGVGYIQTVCQKCNGKNVIVDAKIHKIHIPPGTRSGAKLKIKGGGDVIVSNPENASDIICTIKQKPHPIFKRQGADLYLCVDINLTEALCGFQKPMTHLDGRVIYLRSAPGKVIQPGDMRYIRNEGMPKSSKGRGDLIIMFNVIFPNALANATDCKELEKILPAREERASPDPELEEFNLVKFDPKEQVYNVPFRQSNIYSSEESPMKPKKDELKNPTCTQQ